jgi:hypothetical protein
MIREMMSSLGMMDGWKELVSLAEVVHIGYGSGSRRFGGQLKLGACYIS